MLNKTMIIGNLGAAPEVRVTPGGTTVATLSVATSETWTNKESGKKEKSTEWHRVVFFNRLADIAKQYLKKGSLVYVEGRLRTRKWQDDKGNDRYTTEIIGSSLKMLDSKNKQYTDRMLTEDELDSESN